MDLLLLDQTGQTALIVRRPRRVHQLFHRRAGRHAGLGGILGSNAGRTQARSVTEALARLSGGPFVLEPGQGNLLFTYCADAAGSPSLGLDYWPRWWFDRADDLTASGSPAAEPTPDLAQRPAAARPAATRRPARPGKPVTALLLLALALDVAWQGVRAIAWHGWAAPNWWPRSASSRSSPGRCPTPPRPTRPRTGQRAGPAGTSDVRSAPPAAVSPPMTATGRMSGHATPSRPALPRRAANTSSMSRVKAPGAATAC